MAACGGLGRRFPGVEHRQTAVLARPAVERTPARGSR